MTPSAASVSERGPQALLSRRLYEFPPGIGVRIVAASSAALSYFDAEYGRLANDGCPDLRLDVYVGKYGRIVESLPSGASDWVVHRRRHKLTRWTIGFSGLEEERTRVAFEGQGLMVLPYLQNFYLEPLLRIKFLQAGHALVHGSSLIKGANSVLFPGGSRVGKTSLTLQQALKGKAIQGDNCVIVTPKGQTFAFPRRLRIYSDLRRTYPDAYHRLRLRERIRLRLANLLKDLSFGYANPATRLGIQTFVPDCTIRPIARLHSIFVLTSHGRSELVGPIPLGLDELVEKVQAHSFAEGRWLAEALAPYLGRHPESRLLRAAEIEREILHRAFAEVPAFELLVPCVADPGAIVSRIASITGLDEGPPEQA